MRLTLRAIALAAAAMGIVAALFVWLRPTAAPEDPPDPLPVRAFRAAVWLTDPDRETTELLACGLETDLARHTFLTVRAPEGIADVSWSELTPFGGPTRRWMFVPAFDRSSEIRLPDLERVSIMGTGLWPDDLWLLLTGQSAAQWAAGDPPLRRVGADGTPLRTLHLRHPDRPARELEIDRWVEVGDHLAPATLEIDQVDYGRVSRLELGWELVSADPDAEPSDPRCTAHAPPEALPGADPAALRAPAATP